LISLLSGVPVRDDVGMTGEITLRGQVLPVGGIKQKALAAQRAGITTFILPKRNDVDLDELPEEIHNDLTFVLAETMDDVLKAAMPEGFSERVTNDGHAESVPSSQLAARGVA
jgi:ATP-dependent Lon protease